MGSCPAFKLTSLPRQHVDDWTCRVACRAYRRRHDYYPRPDSGARLLRDDERTSIAEGTSAARDFKWRLIQISPGASSCVKTNKRRKPCKMPFRPGSPKPKSPKADFQNITRIFPIQSPVGAQLHAHAASPYLMRSCLTARTYFWLTTAALARLAVSRSTAWPKASSRALVFSGSSSRAEPACYPCCLLFSAGAASDPFFTTRPTCSRAGCIRHEIGC